MAEIADYQIITKGPFTLEKGKSPSKNLPFDLPVNISTAAGGVLAFVTNVGSGPLAPADVTFRILANNIELTTYNKLKTGTICGLVETFTGGGGKLKIGSNSITFEVTLGSASLTISDVVLWFQRNV